MILNDTQTQTSTREKACQGPSGLIPQESIASRQLSTKNMPFQELGFCAASPICQEIIDLYVGKGPVHVALDHRALSMHQPAMLVAYAVYWQSAEMFTQARMSRTRLQPQRFRCTHTIHAVSDYTGAVRFFGPTHKDLRRQAAVCLTDTCTDCFKSRAWVVQIRALGFVANCSRIVRLLIGAAWSPWGPLACLGASGSSPAFACAPLLQPPGNAPACNIWPSRDPAAAVGSRDRGFPLTAHPRILLAPLHHRGLCPPCRGASSVEWVSLYWQVSLARGPILTGVAPDLNQK